MNLLFVICYIKLFSVVVWGHTYIHSDEKIAHSRKQLFFSPLCYKDVSLLVKSFPLLLTANSLRTCCVLFSFFQSPKTLILILSYSLMIVQGRGIQPALARLFCQLVHEQSQYIVLPICCPVMSMHFFFFFTVKFWTHCGFIVVHRECSSTQSWMLHCPYKNKVV